MISNETGDLLGLGSDTILHLIEYREWEIDNGMVCGRCLG